MDLGTGVSIFSMIIGPVSFIVDRPGKVVVEPELMHLAEATTTTESPSPQNTTWESLQVHGIRPDNIRWPLCQMGAFSMT